jgi:DNA polymerase-1
MFKMMLVGDYLHKSEGQSTRIFEGLLRDSGITRENCYVTNIVNRQLVGGLSECYTDKPRKTPTPELREGILHLQQDIERINPNVIICLGEEATKIVAGVDGVIDWRGSVLRGMDGRKVMPTLHPDYLIKDWMYRPVVVLDLKKAVRESAFPEIRQQARELVVCMEYAQAVEELEKLKGAEYVAFDIETETEQITCISFASRNTPRRAICIPFWFGASGSLHTTEHELHLWGLIQEILTNSQIHKIAHNGLYDAEFIERTLGFRVQGLDYDTMLMAHALYLELPKSLAFYVSIYTDHPYYKFQLKSGDMYEFFKYNATDSCVTMEVFEGLYADLVKNSLLDFYKQYIQSLLYPILDMQLTGVRFDVSRLKVIKVEMEEELVRLQALLTSQVGHELNVNSGVQMKKWLYSELRLKEKTKKRKTTGETTVSADDEALKELYAQTQNEAIQTVLQIREKRKIISTYLNIPLDKDKRIRCSYNITGTETGRLSSGKTTRSTGTNLQNIPAGAIRSLFIADDGCTFINADLSQAEARVVAYLAGESRLIDVFTKGGDIHRKNAANIFGIREEEVSDDKRQLAKRVVHASNYGMGPITFARTAGVTAAEARRLLNQYFATYPGLVNWHLAIKQQLRAKRYLVTPFGRKRVFYALYEEAMFKEGLAYIPQSTVADIVGQAMVCLHSKGVQLLLQVHDSILVQCPDEEVEQTVKVVRECMTRPLTVNGRTLTIPCDVKVGKNWEEMKKI